jgi:hypothetical protein
MDPIGLINLGLLVGAEIDKTQDAAAIAEAKRKRKITMITVGALTVGIIGGILYASNAKKSKLIYALISGIIFGGMGFVVAKKTVK